MCHLFGDGQVACREWITPLQSEQLPVAAGNETDDTEPKQLIMENPPKKKTDEKH